MAISFLSPNRTVLLVADEALYIYTTGSRGVRLVESVPWDVDDFEKNVIGILIKDCGRKPILILNDMVEQHYRKERVIRGGVSILDKSNVLKRKLHVAFPNYPVRAAYPLKEKLPEADSGPAADIYIFAAIPESSQFAKVLAVVKGSFASIAGFCLLPVESSDMVKALSAKLSKGGKTKAQWSVFIGQHKNGGLRQIVTKNGELALTRMTPVAESDEDATAWANDVHQEFKATMSYLARFGYQVEDGLDVTIIADAASGEILEGLITEECSLNILSVADAARTLGIPLGTQDSLRYSDVLHIAWAGRKSRFILPMQAVQIDQVSKPRRIAMLASLALIASGCFLGYQLVNQSQSLSEIKDDLNSANSRKAQLDSQYKREVQRKEELGYDVRLVQSSILVHDTLEAKQIKPLEVLAGIGGALGKDLRVDKVNIRRPDGLNLTNFIIAPISQYGGVAKSEPSLFIATLNMTYPSTTNIDQGNKEVSDLKSRLEKILPGHKVRVTKFLKDYEYVEELIVETGLEKDNVKQDFFAEIIIDGPPPEKKEAQ